MNIILIGMPASGKSTVGKRLARDLHMKWLDTDNLIREKHHDLDLLIAHDLLTQCEEDVVMNCNVDNTVISTGGSVPLNVKAINHLKENGIVVWLDIPLNIIGKRMGDPVQRGVLMGDAKNLEELYEYRKSFYSDCADLIVNDDDYYKIEQYYKRQCEL